MQKAAAVHLQLEAAAFAHAQWNAREIAERAWFVRDRDEALQQAVKMQVCAAERHIEMRYVLDGGEEPESLRVLLQSVKGAGGGVT